MKKFYREYQQEIIKQKIERLKKMNSQLNLHENKSNQLEKNNNINNELKSCFSELNLIKNNKYTNVRSSSVDKINYNNISALPYI